MSTLEKLTIVVPVYNEAENLPILVSRLRAVADLIKESYRVDYLFVNDGSSDDTGAVLQATHERHPEMNYLTLSRNFGHQAALAAGLTCCTESDLIVMMDGDLQDPPEAIPEFISMLENGFDVVYAVRGVRPEGLLKRLCYRVFYVLANRLSTVPLPVESGDFSLFTRRVRDVMVQCNEHLPYFRGLRAYTGFRQTGVTVDREPRYSGHPKYGVGKLIGLALDGLFSFSMIPLRAAWVAGVLGVLVCVLYTGYALLKQYFFGTVPTGFTGTIAVVTFIGSLQLFFIGIVGEYVGRIHAEVKNRPLYVIDWRKSTLSG